MSLFCVFPTKEINDLAKELGLNPAVVAVKVGLLWQSREIPNNTYPSAEDLRNSGLLDDGDSEYKLYGKDTDHRLPSVYGTPNKGMSGVISDNGQAVIVLQKFNENNGSVIGNIKADFTANGLMKNSKIRGLIKDDINKSLIQSYYDANMLLSFIEYEWLAYGADEKVDHYSEPFLNNAVYKYIDNYKDKPAVVVQPQAVTSTKLTPGVQELMKLGKMTKVDNSIMPRIAELDKSRKDYNSVVKRSPAYIALQNMMRNPLGAADASLPDSSSDSLKKMFKELKDLQASANSANMILSRSGDSSAAKTFHSYNEKVTEFIVKYIKEFYGIEAPVVDSGFFINNTQNTQIKGENISSKGSEFAKRLTNPFNKETVEFRGTKFDNAEHAYQTWKSGKFDQKGYDAHGGKIDGTTDYNTNYQTMVEIITAKLQQHPDLVQGIDERGGLAYLNASTHNVIGDEFWEKQGNFMKALTEAYNRVKSMPTKAEKKQYIPSPISTMKDAEHKLNAYIAWQDAQNGGHVRFDEEKHEYYIDGKKADYSVTGYEDELFGKKEIDPKYEFTGVIGTSVDKMLRDYFIERDKGSDGSAIARDRNRSYPNFPLTSGRRKRVVSMGMDIETYLKDRFEGEYKVITKEFYLTGRIKDKQGNDKTIAGTMDMLVIDKYGNLHIFDFKTKSRAAKFFDNFNDKRDYTYQLNAYKQLIEATMPEFKGKVKSLQLIWMAQSYDTNTQYKVDKDTKEITMSDNRPMYKSDNWKGPHLGNAEFNDTKSAIINIEDNTNDTANRLQDVRPYNANWLAQSRQVTQTQNTQDTMNTDDTTKQAKPVLTGEEVRSMELTPEKVLTVTPDDKLKQFNQTFDPMQRTARAEALSHLFSTVVDDFVDEQLEESEQTVDEAKEVLDLLHEQGEYLTPEYYAAKAAYQDAVIKDAKLRDSSTGRQEVIKSVGIAKIIDAIKENINDAISGYRPDLDSDDEAIKNDAKYRVEQYQAMLDNFELLLVYAAPFIANEEHVTLNIHRTTVRKGNTKEDVIDAKVTDAGKEEEEDEKFGDDEEGKNVSGNDGWEYKPRYTNPINRLTHEIKSMLSKIVRLDSNGKVVYDDLGNPKYLPSEFCHAVLINLISKINSPDDFVLDDGNDNVELPALEKFKARYPWIQGVINYIQNSDHPMRTASKFYSDFRNNFISYYRQFRDENGKLKTVALNKITGEESALNRAITNYEQGFRNSYDVTIDGENVTLESIYGKKEEENKENAVKADRFLTEISSILNTLKGQPSLTAEQLESGKIEATDEYEESETPITPEEYARLKQGLQAIFGVIGFEFEGGTLGQMLTNPETLKDLSDALDEASTIFKKVQSPDRDLTTEEKKGDVKVNHLIDFCKNQYKSIAAKIGTVLELEDIQSFRIGDKTLYSFSTVNYIDTMFKELFAPHGTEELESRKQDYLQRQYGKYEWFKNQKSGQWKSGWLKDIESGYIGDTMEIKDIEGTDYPDWTPTQIKAAFIRQFYSIQAVDGKQQEGWFNAPIFANSPVAKFIKFKLVGKREDIIDRLCEVAEQELWRMNLVESRKKAGVNKIANFDIDEKGNARGKQFCFFPQLNDYRVVTTDQGVLLLDKTEAPADTPTFVDVIREDKKKGRDYKRFLERAIEQMMEEGYQDFLKENFEYNEDGSMGEQMTQLAEDIANDHPEYLKDAIDENGKPILDKKGNPVKEKTLRKEVFLNLLEKYYYEQVYASTQIIELTTTDLAYYKNGTDFQKRYKELYASGKKLNTNSQFGRKIERTAYIKDAILTSHSYTSIKRVLDRAVALGHIQSYDRDAILEKFKDVNQADAQAYRNLDSMKALLDMIGEWTDDMERALNNFRNGEWTMEDFNLVWQTIKPFVYTQIEKPNGLSGENAGVIKVPHQNKNSEFLILAFYNVITSPINGSPILRAMDKFMSDNEIDVLQFESAAKAGNQGTIDFSYSEDKLFDVYRQLNESSELESLQALFDAVFGKGKVDALNTDNWTYKNYKKSMDYMLDNNLVSQDVYNDYMKAVEPDEDEVYRMLTEQIGTKDNYNPESVHEIPYDDYVIQQPTPEHLFDVDAVFGSQFRNLIISDMPDDIKIVVNGKEYNKKQIRDLYQAIIVENLLEDWEKVESKYSTIEKLQAALKDAIESNTSKYSRDLLNAIEIITVVNPVTGLEEKVFNIPLDNPSTTEKLQQITNSMFKNAIQKQKIKGGACILVSDFGLTGQLHVKFKKYKKVINEKGEEVEVGDIEGGLEGIECYLPAYSKKFYTPFMKTKDDGTQYLDINSMPENLRKIIGYRIPTEDKYSMAPLIVKGFLPQQNGSSIMLPAEITQIAGSDFDVDKMFLMIPEFIVREKYSVRDIKRAWDDFYLENPDIAQEIAQGKAQLVQAYGELLQEQHPDWNWEFESEEARTKFLLNAALKDGVITVNGKEVDKLRNYNFSENAKPKFKEWLDKNRDKYLKVEKTIVEKVEYNSNLTPEFNDRRARNNMLIDISYAILQHPDTAEKILNPGNFDKMKTAERIATITSDNRLKANFAEYLGIDPNDSNTLADAILEISTKGQLDKLDKFLKDYKKERSPLTLDTFIYNHSRNMKGDALIGMYANNTSMQAKYQETGISIKDKDTFVVNGRRISSLHEIFSKDNDGNLLERISKNCANGSAASVDNVKDPTLDGLKQNTKTANITGFMLRAGMSWQEIGLLFTQPIIGSLVDKYGDLNLLPDQISYVETRLKALGTTVKENMLTHNFTSKEMLLNILNKDKAAALWLNHKAREKEIKQDKFDKMSAKELKDYINIQSIKLSVLSSQEDVLKYIEENTDKVREEIRKAEEAKGITRESHEAEYNAYLANDPNVKFLIDYYTSTVMVANLMQHIMELSKNLSDATQISRADSPNGAIKHDIAGARAQIAAVDRYNTWISKPDFYLTSKDSEGNEYDMKDDIIKNDFLSLNDSRSTKRKKLMSAKMPMLQAFYSLGIDLAYKLVGQYYTYTQPAVDKIVRQLYNNTERGQVYDTILKKFYNEIMEWGLTKTDLFGGEDFEAKRNYYLYEYPDVFNKTVKANPNLKKINILKKITVNKGDLVYEKSGRLSVLTRETLMRDFDSLLYSDDVNAQQLAVDLFMYCFYKSGLKFGATGFGSFFSTNFLTSFPEYINALRTMKFMAADENSQYFDGFLEQFYINHFNDDRTFLMPYYDSKKIIGKRDSKNNTIAYFQKDNNGKEYLAIRNGYVWNQNMYYSQKKHESFQYIKIFRRFKTKEGRETGKMELYKVWGDGNSPSRPSDYTTYLLVPTLTKEQKDKRGVKYNANMTAEELAAIQVDKEKMQKNAQIKAGSYDDESIEGLMPIDPYDDNEEINEAFDDEEESVVDASNEFDDDEEIKFFNGKKLDINNNYDDVEDNFGDFEDEEFNGPEDDYDPEEGQEVLEEPVCTNKGKV